MALWQWDFWLVPKGELVKKFPTLPTYLDLDWFESTTHWATVDHIELISFLDTLLPRYDTPWAENTQSWGSDAGDRIQLVIEDQIIVDLFVRLDLRDLNVKFLSTLIDFALREDYLIYVLETRKLIEPVYGVVLSSLQTSRKQVFVSDPERFFADKEYLEKVNREALRQLKQR